MARFAVTVLKADNTVTGTWRGGDASIPSLPGTDASRIEEITEAEHASMQAVGLTYPGGVARWLHNGTALVEDPDTRPLVRFTPEVTEVDVGDTGVTVTIEVINRTTGLPMTGLNSPQVLSLTDGRKLRIPFTAGVSVRPIPTGKAYTASPASTGQYEVEGNPIVVVRATSLEP